MADLNELLAAIEARWVGPYISVTHDGHEDPDAPADVPRLCAALRQCMADGLTTETYRKVTAILEGRDA